MSFKYYDVALPTRRRPTRRLRYCVGPFLAGFITGLLFVAWLV